MFEYVCSKAAAWDCPVSLEAKTDQFKAHPRTADNLEVFRRWEDARLSNYFSEEQKEAMKDPYREHILLVDEEGQFELQTYDQIEGAAQGNADIRAFVFDRSGKTIVVYSHNSGEGKLALKPFNGNVHLFKELGSEIPVREENDLIIIPAGDRYYLEMDMDKGGAIATFREARVL